MTMKIATDGTSFAAITQLQARFMRDLVEQARTAKTDSDREGALGELEARIDALLVLARRELGLAPDEGRIR